MNGCPSPSRHCSFVRKRFSTKIAFVERSPLPGRSRSPRSRSKMEAPVAASPAATVAPPMPEPTMTMSGDGGMEDQAMRAWVSGSKKTALSRRKAKGIVSPARALQSGLIRATTSLPPSRVTT